jgi:putative DNA primase/helicase
VSFLLFAASHGLVIRDLRDDGRIHRCPTSSKPKSDNGAYLLERDRGWVMDWAAGDGVHWWNDPRARPWTEAEKAEVRRRHAHEARERARRAAQAAREARDMLSEAELVLPRAALPWRPGRAVVEAVSAHPYLIAKGFPLEPGFVRDDELLIPMMDAKDYGAPIGLQRIQPDGRKKFLHGQRARGAIHRFGNGAARETWLCEGYATALSVRAALKKLYRQADVIACFSAGNLAHVASLGIGTHVMADHDASRAGQEAAASTGLPWVMPARVGMDANDVMQAEGIEAVVGLVQRHS